MLMMFTDFVPRQDRLRTRHEWKKLSKQRSSITEREYQHTKRRRQIAEKSRKAQRRYH